MTSTPGFSMTKWVHIYPATPVADYTIRVDLNSTFDYVSCQADGDDIRFFDEGGLPLPFWMERWASGGDSIIWVKIHSAGTASIKMAYGNSTIGPGSNGDDTFVFFDDFSGASIDPLKWVLDGDAYSTGTIVDGKVHLRSSCPYPIFGATWMGFSDSSITHGVTSGARVSYSASRRNEFLHTELADIFTMTPVIKNQTTILMDYYWINSTRVVFKENESIVAMHETNVPTDALPANFGVRTVYYGSGLNYGALIRSLATFAPGHAIRGKYWFQHDSRGTYPVLEPTLDLDWVFVRNAPANESMTWIESPAGPQMTVNSPPGGTVFASSSVFLNVTVVDPQLDSIWYRLDGGAIVLLPANTSIIVPDGTHSITFYANDTFGHVTSVERGFTVDTGAPVVAITSPAPGAFLSSNDVNVTFTATDLTKDATWYTLDGGVPTIVVGSSIMLDGLVDGTHLVEISCNDSSGRVSMDLVSFVIDASPPSIDINGFSDLSVQQGDIAYLNWTMHDAHPSTYSLRLNGQVIRSGFYTNGTAVAVLVDSSEQRLLNYTMIVQDALGNVKRHERLINVLPRFDDGIFLMAGVNVIDRQGTLGISMTLTMSHWAVLYLDVKATITSPSQLHAGALPPGYVLALPVAINLNITNSSALENGRIRVYYAQADIATQIDEATLVAMRWNEVTSRWEACTSGFGRSQNFIEINLSSTGLHVFVAMPKPSYTVPLIILLIGITAGFVAAASYNQYRKNAVMAKAAGKGKPSRASNYDDASISPARLPGDPFRDAISAKRARILNLPKPESSMLQGPATRTASASGLVAGDALKKKVATSEPDVDIAARAENARKMASEVSVEPVVPRCIVHKGPIAGLSYTCEHCGVQYCITCARHLANIAEKCWNCGVPVKSGSLLTEGESIVPENHVDGNVTLIEPEVFAKIAEIGIEEGVIDELLLLLKDIPPNRRLQYVEDMHKEVMDADKEGDL